MAMSNLLAKAGFVTPCFFEVTFRKPGGEPADTFEVKGKTDRPDVLPCYTIGDHVLGDIKVTPFPGKRVDHSGIKAQLVGRIQHGSERSEFVALVRELAAPGDLRTAETFPFEFRNPDMRFECYRGRNVELHYFLRVTVQQKMGKFEQKFPLWVKGYEEEEKDTASPPLRMEVGIEDCLHLEFEFGRDRYHLQDVIVGRIRFLLVRIRLKHMEVEIRRRETTGSGTTASNDTETIARFEIMEGSPARGTVIPLRLFLGPYPLTPSFKSVNNRFSVRYFLNLVLVDEEERRYFKQQEITLYRSAAADRGLGPIGVPLPPRIAAPSDRELGAGPAVPLAYVQRRALARPSASFGAAEDPPSTSEPATPPPPYAALTTPPTAHAPLFSSLPPPPRPDHHPTTTPSVSTANGASPAPLSARVVRPSASLLESEPLGGLPPPGPSVSLPLEGDPMASLAGLDSKGDLMASVSLADGESVSSPLHPGERLPLGEAS